MNTYDLKFSSKFTPVAGFKKIATLDNVKNL